MSFQEKPSPIPFNVPYVTGREFDYIQEAILAGHLSGGGKFTKLCHEWLEAHTGAKKALLTHSCTAALEMCAMLANVGQGDEVIMPSYTFVSTANAFVLRGATPVFVDIRPDTLNIDETKIEAAITEKTKAICVVHYAGVACEMNAIASIAKKHDLILIEDDAQGILSSYQGKNLGGLSHFSAISFHETKNIISGEGGALLINDESFADRAEVLWEKGTDRRRFFRGMVDKYTWQDIGSSFLPSELEAAFLWAQMEDAKQLTEKRLNIWNRYHAALRPLEDKNLLRRPIVPEGCVHNAHMYYVLLPTESKRNALMDALKRKQIYTVFHYVPLHSSPAGEKFCRTSGAMSVTENFAGRVLRLPVWTGMDEVQVRQVVHEITHAIMGL